MKKRILSLLLAVITILQMFPVFALPTIAEDGVEELSVDDMEVGKLYRAEFYSDTFTPYILFPYEAHEEWPNKAEDLPAELVVMRKNVDGLDLVYVSEFTGNWPEEYNEYRYVSASQLVISGVADVNDMVIDQIYLATWDYTDGLVELYKAASEEGAGSFMPYKNDAGGLTSTDGFPAELIVRLNNEYDFCVYVTNKDWPAAYEQYRYLDPFDLTILGEYVAPPADDGLVYGQVGLVMDGESVETLAIAKGEKTYVFTELGSAIEGTPTYRWQMLLDRESNSWANIQDYVYPYAPISEALLANAGLEDGTATLRCIATQDGINYASGELDITVDPTLPDPEPPLIPEPETEADPESRNTAVTAGSKTGNDGNTRAVEAFQVTVQYVYWNGSPLENSGHGDTVLPTYTATVGGAYPPLTTKVRSLPIAGYEPYVRVDENVEGSRPYAARENPLDPNSPIEEHYYVKAPFVEFFEQTTAKNVIVYYLPVEVSFTVNHYIQNLTDDEYTPISSVEKKGYPAYPVGDTLHEDRYGFTHLFYDPETPISANGNTIVNIYYDREYYLVDFDLTEPKSKSEGYGVMPLYVRYETPIQVSTPQNPGYTFDGWELVRVYNKTEEVDADGKVTVTETPIDDATIKSQYSDPSVGVTVKHNLEYKAIWEVATTSYTLIYWLENADSTDATNKSNYSIWHTKVISAQTGANTVSGKDDIKNNVTGNALTEVNRDYPFLTYEASLTDTNPQKVNADGTTTVNVYYKRNEYTLRFYYARKDGNSWYVAGMTDQFAKESSNWIERNDELALLDNVTRWGQVTSEPKLLDGITNSKGYDERTVTYNNRTYKYFSFKAKYGADIGNKWPIDILNTVERTETNGNGWPEKTAVMSAWTGEYNVKHQHDNPNGSGNQTIKGKYEVLDDYLMWDPNYDGWKTTYNDGTISFLCFWENARAGLGWNVPELYRYKIWLPTLPGKTYETTVTHNGVTYYLFDSYDTCDNSTVNEQTHPALTGYVNNGRIAVPNGANDTTNLFNQNNFNNLSNRQYTTQVEYNEIRSQNYRDKYIRAYIVNYFYTRNTHQLIMNDNAGSTSSKPVAYGEKLNGFDIEPNYPAVFEPGNYTFEGWYQNEACTVKFDFNTTMPDKNVQLYAKWQPTTFNITVYQEKPIDGDPLPTVLWEHYDVPFGTLPNTLGEEPERVSPIKDYIFAGWYYEEPNGTEKRFDFNTMPIKQNYVIYAKWTSKVPVIFEVRYVTEKDGNIIEIADRTEGKSLAGVAKSFTAKAGKDLYDGYQTGYFPTEREQTQMLVHKVEDDGKNIITFTYVTSETIQYQIRHIFVSDDFIDTLGTNKIELIWQAEITETSTLSALLTEDFKANMTEPIVVAKMVENHITADVATNLWREHIVHMAPDGFSKSLILCANVPADENEIVFSWTELQHITIYEVHHMFEVSDGVYELKGDPHVYNARYEENKNATLPEAVVKTGYDYTGTYTTNNDDGKSLQLKPVNATTDEGLIIYMYYNRKDYSYTVRYIDEKNFQIYQDNETRTGKYMQELVVGDIVKDVTIQDYELVNGDAIVTLDSPGKVIDCVYRKKTASYFYRALSGSGRFSFTEQLDVPLNEQPKTVEVQPDRGWILKQWYYGDVFGNNLQAITADVATMDDDGNLTPRAPTTEDAGKDFYFWAEFVPTSLTISGFFSGEFNPHPYLQNQGFIYHINGKKDTDTAGYSITVALPIGESKSILGLPAGEYTITVESTWSWRYSGTNIGYTVTENDDSGSWDAGAQKLTFKFDGSATVEFKFTPPAKDSDKTDGYFITDEVHN